MSAEYRITTIKELVDTATPENIDFLLADLKNFVLMTKMTIDANIPTNNSCFIWVDDGKNDINVQCIDGKCTFEKTDDPIVNDTDTIKINLAGETYVCKK